MLSRVVDVKMSPCKLVLDNDDILFSDDFVRKFLSNNKSDSSENETEAFIIDSGSSKPLSSYKLIVGTWSGAENSYKVLAEITKEGMREIYGAASENNNMGKRSAEALKNTPKKTKNR